MRVLTVTLYLTFLYVYFLFSVFYGWVMESNAFYLLYALCILSIVYCGLKNTYEFLSSSFQKLIQLLCCFVRSSSSSSSRRISRRNSISRRIHDHVFYSNTHKEKLYHKFFRMNRIVTYIIC